MTQYYVTSVGTKSMESFSVNPIVVHMEWEELNNYQFLWLPPLVWWFLNEATVDLVLLDALEQFEDQATDRLLPSVLEDMKTQAQHNKRG